MKQVLRLTTILVFLFSQGVFAQNVMDPNDAVINYDATADPGTPSNPTVPFAGVVAKWVRTKHPRVTWNTDSYKAYIYNGVAYRLRFPKNYLTQPTRKFPVMVFFHGGGEIGPRTDNEFHLLWGAQKFAQDADNNLFDCFILFPQQTTVGWEETYIGATNGILDSLAKYHRVDEDRIITMGLSAGGFGCINHAAISPKRIAKVIGSAAAYIDFLTPQIPKLIEIPHWLSSGGRDPRPDTLSMRRFLEPFAAAGGNMIHSYYPNEGHVTWTRQWSEPIYYSELNSAHKANPLVYFGRKDFCPDSPIVARLALTPGFFAYEWQKDGVTIPSATANDYFPNAYGTYRARFKRADTSQWSEWSPSPVVVGIKSVTQTPPIIVSGIRSKVLPALDGSTTVPLELPTGFTSYQWRQNGSPTIIGNQRNFVAGVGSYVGNVVEQFGCSSVPSPVFQVVNANGSQKPDRAKNVAAYATGGGTIQVEWSKNANSLFPTINFEVYRATKSGGPYTLVGITDANTVGFSDAGLTPSQTYFYVVRAVNNFAAAATSNEAQVQAQPDLIAPTAPSNLKVIYQSREFVELEWDGSTDNVAVRYYDVYVNGKRAYTFDTTTLTRRIYNLAQRENFIFTIKARDESNNSSAPSNQVSGGTFYSGLRYRYYEGTWELLPDFDKVPVIDIGTVSTFSITPRQVSDRFAFVWEGYLIIPAGMGGNYTFRTTSDDGSKLYIRSFYNHLNTPIVNNDGLHGNVTVTSAAINLPEGAYQINGTFFEATGGEVMTVEYRGPATNNAWVSMPASAFAESRGTLPAAPTAPTFVKAIANGSSQIDLSWTDNATNETGYEIVRASSALGPFLPLATVAADVNSYQDQGLLANTTYFYRVRAIGLGGESAFASSTTEANWKLNQNALEEGGNTSRNLTISGTITYSTADKREGTAALTFIPAQSTGASVNNSTSGGFPSNAYTERTVALWIKPSSISTKQMLFDLGGNNNGLALRINSTGTLTAGIASNNTRVTISTTTPLTINTWVHLAIVYRTNSLRLFVNGVEVVANNAMSFTSIPAGSSSSSRFGLPNGTSTNDNAFNDGSYVAYSGLMDNIFIIGNSITVAEIQALMDDSFHDSNARTGASPNVPNSPTLLTATTISNKQINLRWKDNASNETAYEVYRSANNNSNFRLLGTLSSNDSLFVDSTCFPNAQYFYRVRAMNTTVASTYSNETNARTFNTAPVLKDVADFTMRHGTSITIPIQATDLDLDDLIFTSRTLPRFATYNQISNELGNLVLTPQQIHQGTYRFRFIVSDPNNGKDTIQFVVVVNDNNVPTISPISNMVVNEGATATASLTAADVENSSKIRWVFDSLPAFGTFVPNGTGGGQLTLTPGYASAGTYRVTAKVDDGLGAWSQQAFTIVVNNQSPNTKWLINIKVNTDAPAPWNNWSTNSISNLKNTANQTTSVGAALIQPFSVERYEFGTNTGNNSGYYPDAVLRDNFYLSGNTDTLSLQLNGLNPATLYNIRFMSASNNFSESVLARTGFRIGNRRDSVAIKNNTTNTAYLAGIAPDASGNILVRIYRSMGAQTAYLNAIELEANFNDGTLPIKPTGLTGVFQKGIGNKLTWKDIAYNESQYQVYRATIKTGPYTLLNPGSFNVNDTSYIDQSVQVSTTYYYFITAVNSIGFAPNTDTISITTGNNPPLINGVNDLFVKANSTATLNFNTADDQGDVLSVTVSGLPAFATLNNLGSGQYSIIANPTRDHIGWYYLTVVSKDDKGGETKRAFRIVVSDDLTRTLLVNFATETQKVGRPWNNLSFGYAPAGLTTNNLVDDQNQPTTMGITLVTDFLQFDIGGFNTGNNSGIVPDSVLFTGLSDFTNTLRTFRLTGLNPAKLYSVGIVSSNNSGHTATTSFSSGPQTVITDARHNSDVQGRLNGLIPNAQGQINIDVQKVVTNNWYGYLNAIIVDEYDPTTTPILSPATLRAEPLTRKSIRLYWADRSNNETGGFEVFRATNEAGPFNMIGNVPSNTTQYIDSTVNGNTRYFYRVRAAGSSGTTSAFSNTIATISSSGVVYVNLNATNPGNNGNDKWNNTGKTPVQGDVYKGFEDEIGFTTGYTLTLQTGIGAFTQGSTASPANSGIFPDSVLASNYIVPKGQVVTYKISGLDQTKRYRIGFGGSSAGNGGYNTTMTIGNRTVYLGVMYNTNKAVYIGDNQPDEYGDIYVNFGSTNSPETQYGIIGALVIQAYGDEEEGGSILNRIAPAEFNPLLRTQSNQEIVLQALSAYPNPFTDQINVQVKYPNPIGSLTLDLYDMAGRLLIRNNRGNLPAGNNTIQLNVSELPMPPGTYFVKVHVNNQPAGIVKLLKTN